MESGLHHNKDHMIVLLKHIYMWHEDKHTNSDEQVKIVSHNKFQHLTATCTFATEINMAIWHLTWMLQQPSCRALHNEHFDISYAPFGSTCTKLSSPQACNKITVNISFKHITLSQQGLGHQDELKQACHNGTKWRAYHHDHFDISFTQFGSPHKKLQPYKDAT